MRTISSRQNPTVSAYRTLAKEADPSGARLLLDGAHLVREAYEAGLSFESVAVARSHLSAATEEGVLAEMLHGTGVDVLAADDRAFAALSPVRTPNGIVAIAHRRATEAGAILQHPRAFVVVIVDVQDPGNVGAVVRVAEAGGATGMIVCGDSASPFSWKAVRGSMGSVLRLPVARAIAVTSVLDDIQHAGLIRIASVPRNGADPDIIDWSGRAAVLLGGEANGLHATVVAACDRHVTIPMNSPVESLNVATSAAILIYAARRARQ